MLYASDYTGNVETILVSSGTQFWRMTHIQDAETILLPAPAERERAVHSSGQFARLAKNN